jgi:preprotein translocase subunit SecG
MTALPTLSAGFIMTVVAVLWFFCALILILVILIQKGRGGGLSGAFGGMGGGILGTKTGDFLTWVTVGLVCAFLFLSVVIAKYYKPMISKSVAPQVTTESRQAEQPVQAPPFEETETAVPTGEPPEQAR